MKRRQMRQAEQKLTIEEALMGKKSISQYKSIEIQNPPSPKQLQQLKFINKQKSKSFKSTIFRKQESLLSHNRFKQKQQNKILQFPYTNQLANNKLNNSQEIRRSVKSLSNGTQNNDIKKRNTIQKDFYLSKTKKIQWKLLKKRNINQSFKNSHQFYHNQTDKTDKGLNMKFQNLKVNTKSVKQPKFKRYNTLNENSNDVEQKMKQNQFERQYTKLHVKIKDLQEDQNQNLNNTKINESFSNETFQIKQDSILKQKNRTELQSANIVWFQFDKSNKLRSNLLQEIETNSRAQQIQSCKIITKTQISVGNVQNKFSATFDGCTKLKTLKSLKAMKSFRSMNTTYKSIFSCGEKQSAMQGLKVQIISKNNKVTVWKVKPYQFGDFIIKKKIRNANKIGSTQLQILDILSGHPFIVCLFEAFKLAQHDGHSLQLFMQYFPQGSLNQRIYIEGSIHLQKVKIYAYQIFRGLHFIHFKNIYHRNICAENIFLRKDKIAIGGFGNAKFGKPNNNECIFMIGSVEQRAPELLFGNYCYDEKADIWSAGCVLVEMILGRKLFVSDYPQDTLIEIIKIRGSPTKEQFRAMNPNYENMLKNWKLPERLNPKEWKYILQERNLDKNLKNLLDGIFQYNPNTRLTALQILSHPYFDDIREQMYYQRISQKYQIQQDFFIFATDELPKHHSSLIPSWVQINNQENI